MQCSHHAEALQQPAGQNHTNAVLSWEVLSYALVNLPTSASPAQRADHGLWLEVCGSGCGRGLCGMQERAMPPAQPRQRPYLTHMMHETNVLECIMRTGKQETGVTWLLRARAHTHTHLRCVVSDMVVTKAGEKVGLG